MKTRLLSALVLFLCLLPAALPVSGAGQDAGWDTLSTPHFVVYYAAGNEEYAGKYAAAGEDAFTDITEILGHSPIPPITIRVYPTLESYAEVNPLAKREDGVVGDASSPQKLINLSDPKMRALSPELMKAVVRHEFTHIVLGEMSDQKLPVGFQEGIAQYFEGDLQKTGQSQAVVSLISRANESGTLLTLSDLESRDGFYSDVSVSYPESYGFVAFLVDTYGFNPLRKFVTELAQSDSDYHPVLARAYGKSESQLEAEWRNYLPGFISDRWRVNYVDLYHLQAPSEELSAGDYKKALASLDLVRPFILEVGNPDKIRSLNEMTRQAQSGVQSEQLMQEATSALARGHSSEARAGFTQAEQLYRQIGDAQRAGLAASKSSQINVDNNTRQPKAPSRGVSLLHQGSHLIQNLLSWTRHVLLEMDNAAMGSY